MKPIKTFKKSFIANGDYWVCYCEIFKTRKHVYIKPWGWEFFTFDFILKGKEYNQDVIYHAVQYATGRLY